MVEDKLIEIKSFFIQNADPAIVEKYSRYFKDGFNGYGIPQKVYEAQRDTWINDWKFLSIVDILAIGDRLMESRKYEEISLAISLLASKKDDFTPEIFDRFGHWFLLGIDNWASTDVLCMFVLSDLIRNNIISLSKLSEWNNSHSEWQRRAVPVTLYEVAKKPGIKPKDALSIVENLMEDKSQYVQKGIGTLLRELWKKYPKEIEAFLLKWKDKSGRLIIQYATEKMDKDYRKKFRKSKK